MEDLWYDTGETSQNELSVLPPLLFLLSAISCLFFIIYIICHFPFILFVIVFFASLFCLSFLFITVNSFALFLLFCLFLFGSVFLSGYPGSYCIFYVALYCQVHPLCSYSLPISCFLFPVLCWWAENRLSVVSFHHAAVWTLSFHRGECKHWFLVFFWRTIQQTS